MTDEKLFGVITNDNVVLAAGLPQTEAEAELTRALNEDVDAYLWDPENYGGELPCVKCVCTVHTLELNEENHDEQQFTIDGTLQPPIEVVVRKYPADVAEAVLKELPDEFQNIPLHIEVEGAAAVDPQQMH